MLRVAEINFTAGETKMNARIIGIVAGLVLIAGVVAADVLLFWP